jgi:hypothetical protein
MPTISMFYGIIVYMAYRESTQHHLPHVHVRYGNEKAALAIADGAVLEGSLQTAKLRMVQTWMDIHREDLLTAWALAREGQTVDKIEPLR